MSDEQDFEREPLRHRLIVAGMAEIATHGVADFSLRRVASACQISCAAPYKHFKNREELLREILRYIHGQWSLLRGEVFRLFAGDSRRLILEVGLAYVRFFASNPYFRTVLSATGKGEAPDDKLEAPVAAYCRERSLDTEEEGQRLFRLRALLAGTVAMLEDGALGGSEQACALLRTAIEREFS